MGTKHYLLLTSALALALSSCTGKAPSAPAETLSAQNAEKLARSGNLSGAADEFARIGELLLTPEAFIYADKMFDSALKLQPGHPKANFYSAFTKPLLTLQGILKRYEPMATVQELQGIKSFREDLAKLNYPELLKFVDDVASGSGVFKDRHDIQRYVRTELLPALAESTEKLGRIDATQPFDLYVNLKKMGYEASGQTVYYSCYSTGGGYGGYGGDYQCDTYVYGDSNTLEAKHLVVDATDVQVLRSSFRTATDAARVYSAYSMEGLEAAAETVLGYFNDYSAEQGWGIAISLNELADYGYTPLTFLIETARMGGWGFTTSRKVVEAVRAQPELFALELDHQLGQLPRSVSETLKGVLELKALENQICRSPREGSLFKRVCVSNWNASFARDLLDALAGPRELVMGRDHAGQPITILTDISGVLQKPVRDLKQFLPSAWDEQGNPVAYNDGTVGGLFPKGDFFQKAEKAQMVRFPLFMKGERIFQDLVNSLERLPRPFKF
jgi:hypothetical protein